MSKKSGKGNSLSEKLASLINTKPVLIDPDDDDDQDFTKPEQIAPCDGESDVSGDELDLGQFRKLNIEFLDAEDTKYSGKKSSRAEHAKAFGNDSSSEVDSTDENTEPEESYAKDEEVEEAEEEGDEEDEDAEDEPTEVKDKTNVEGADDDFNKDIISKVSGDIEKGRAIKNQLHIWDFLLELRMKFQQCLITSNQLPKHDSMKKFEYHGGEQFRNLLTENQNSLQHVLNSLIELQDVLLGRNEEYKRLSSKHKLPSDDEDEEIPSDSDAENEASVEPVQKQKRKRIKLSDFSTDINERHKQMEKFRNETIQKWNDKTRISQMTNKNFSAFEQPTLKQIEYVLSDKDRLIKRTQVKRTNYHILGQTDEDSPPSKIMKTDGLTDDMLLDYENKLANERKNSQKLFKEIYDDDDFYHQLLSELVRRKTDGITDPIEATRQWVLLEQNRPIKRKVYDNKANKDRKIKYVVHQKLVNFMMPIYKTLCDDASRTELMNSLFGKDKK